MCTNTEYVGFPLPKSDSVKLSSQVVASTAVLDTTPMPIRTEHGISVVERMGPVSKSRSSLSLISSDEDLSYDFERFAAQLNSDDQDLSVPADAVTSISTTSEVAIDQQSLQSVLPANFNDPKDVYRRMALRYITSNMLTKRDLIKAIFSNEPENITGKTMKALRHKLDRAMDSAERVRLIARECAFDDKAVNALMLLYKNTLY